MWDYDKLFAEGNIVGVKNIAKGTLFPMVVEKNNTETLNLYKNDKLTFHAHCVVDVSHSYPTDFEIQYIIRLDEHGNVVEKLFERDRDMVEPMPKLETGMFVRINNSTWDENHLGFIDVENNHIIYQDGGYDVIDDDEFGPGVARYVVEIYSKDACAFGYCCDNFLIWRDPKYQAYLDSKSK